MARKASVTTGAVTYYFEDKDALLLAAFREVSAALFEQIRAFEGGWCIDRFVNSLPTSPTRRRHWSVWLAFCGRAQTSEPMNEIYRDFYAALEQTLADETGESDPARARALAGSTIAAVDGVGLCATLHPKLWPAVRQREALRTLLGKGLGLTDDEEIGHG